MKQILLIDDDTNLCKVIEHQLQKNGFDVTATTRSKEGLAIFHKQTFDIVILDIQMPEMTGIQVLNEIRRLNQHIIVIMITAYGSVDNALEACRLGANDYITKPFGQEQLLFVIEKAVRLQTLRFENKQLRQELGAKYSFDNMIANSSLMKEVLRVSGRVAASNTTVLILGESGTGKEVLAKAIHYNSKRKDKALVTVNCPSIPENLLESTLFGHRKGAFTGAIADRTGQFEQAHTGTIFLDEIGDLSEGLQAKLLRVLQEREFERVGDSKIVKVDVRVIAATNKDLIQLVTDGKFREDLYYRLSVVPVILPPLNKRQEDIPYLVDFFIARHGSEQKFIIESEVIHALKQYSWPGNIRELENVIERAIVLTDTSRLTLSDLPSHIQKPIQRTSDSVLPIPPQGIALEDVERHLFSETLKLADGNQSEAARILKIPRHVLLYRLKKLGLD